MTIKLTESRLRQIIKEEIQNLSEKRYTGYNGPEIRPENLVKGKRYDLVHPDGTGKKPVKFWGHLDSDPKQKDMEVLIWDLMAHPDVQWKAIKNGKGRTGWQQWWNKELVDLIITPPNALPNQKPDALEISATAIYPGNVDLNIYKGSDRTYVSAPHNGDQVKNLRTQAAWAGFNVDLKDIDAALDQPGKRLDITSKGM